MTVEILKALVFGISLTIAIMPVISRFSNQDYEVTLALPGVFIVGVMIGAAL